MKLLDEIAHHLAQHAGQERAKGNPKANALACVVVGLVLLPIPIIGFPLLCYGLYKWSN